MSRDANSRQYLALPPAYAAALGRLRWSESEGSLTFFDGLQLASCEDLAQFLEGFATQRPLPAFGSVAHWAALFNLPTAEVGRLHKAFVATQANWRNAGALAGMLSHSLPSAADPPDLAAVCARLRDPALPIRWYTGALNGPANAGEEPAHTTAEFERYVLNRLARLTDADLAQWLEFGRGPLDQPGRELARVEPPPRVTGTVLEELLRRPRLAAAAAYLPQMVLAVTVPPRRQSPEQLPIGGYADLVAHGNVDRLLPSQHALDELEFLRRFCENELLYFRREEPPAAARQEIVVVLDQGVRTWGDVRLVLTAAALALLRGADRKAMVRHLALTSDAKLYVNPLEDRDEELGPALEASDFSRHPGLALENVLEGPASVPRDIFLLTHPFSILEPAVQAAARRLLPRDRLFALTVNSAGDAELLELRRGLPVRLRSFHVDFVAAPIPAPVVVEETQGWSGAVESVGWPFRFGTDGPIYQFAFDDSARRLMAITANSMIWTWDLTDGALEILPRPQTLNGRVREWRGIEGVASGFALLGHQDSRYVVCHYDWRKRQCTVHETSLTTEQAICLSYVRHLHTVILFLRYYGPPLLAIDLETGTRTYMRCDAASGAPQYETVGREGPKESAPENHQRAEEALRYVQETGPHPGVVMPANVDLKGPSYSIGSDGSVSIFNAATKWNAFIPQNEGKKVISKGTVQNLRLADQTLTIHYSERLDAKRGFNQIVACFRSSDGHFLRQLSWHSPTDFYSPIALARNGKKLALARNDRQVEVQHTERPERIFLTRPGGYSTLSRLWVGENGLLLKCGRKGYAWHLLLWANQRLEVHSQILRYSGPLDFNVFDSPQIRDFVCDCDPQETTVSSALLNDSERWPKAWQQDGTLFVLDRYGQVLVFNAALQVVFQFFAHGDTWSAWLPDGTRHGLGSVHHWPNTPGALAAMGQALRTAMGGKRA